VKVTRRRSARPQALLSGQAGVVVFNDGASCTCRAIGESDYRQCRLEDIPYLFGDASDVISVAGKSPAQAYRILENEWTQDRALHLVLLLLDRDAHLRAKRIASEALEEFLVVSTTRQFVIHRLYSRPLPSSADVSEALRLCMEASGKSGWGLISTVREDQSRIRHLRERWDLLDLHLFGTARDKRLFEQVAVEEGMFFSLCRDPASMTEKALSQWASNPRLKKFSRRGKVIETWAAPFVGQRKPPAVAAQMELFDATSGHGVRNS
jgi:hypothetical protein